MGRIRGLFSDLFIASGVAIVIFSIGLVLLILITAVPVGNPYIGLFVFIYLPILLVIGGALFVFGTVLTRREGRFSVRDSIRQLVKAYAGAFAEPQQRRRATFFLAAGVVEVLVMAMGGMRLAAFMDTPTFCGQVCHNVMYPEFTVYQNSPHARVSCVQCHIGPGAPWLVRSKVSGVRQVLATTFNTYDRPIPAPVKELRPARETCEVCHWPQKFSGDLVRVIRHYADDEANTERSQTMIFKVGGGAPGVARGIHWHIGAQVSYLPLDEARQMIAWVGIEREDGQREAFVDPARVSEISEERIARDKRLMDCVDCHNRATHIFRSPSELIEEALARGKIEAGLPYIKKKGMEVLTPPSASLDQALAKVESLRAFYRDSYPRVYAEKADSLGRSLEELKQIARLTTFPDMKVTWETYARNIGHTKSPGCFRCHGKLVSAGKGQRLSAECNLCHAFSPGR